MKKLFLLVLLVALPANADKWSIGIGTGPFVFGQFVKRTVRIATPSGSETQTTTLSAATRAGLAVDLERGFGDRYGVRLEAAFTRAPIGIKGTERQDETVDIPAGDIDVTTLALPLLIRINPQGTFRFHVMGGPAAAAYSIRTRRNAAATIPFFRGTRTRVGVAIGAGLAWQWNEYFAIEGNITDINTASPFSPEEIGGLGGVETPRPNHLHTTVGLRYRF